MADYLSGIDNGPVFNMWYNEEKKRRKEGGRVLKINEEVRERKNMVASSIFIVSLTRFRTEADFRYVFEGVFRKV